MALFQHHDGITGTARDHVVVDYGQRMLRSIQDSVRVMELSTNYLLTKFKEDYKEELNNVPVIHFVESREHFDQIPIKKVVIISNQPSFVVLYNSLAQERMQVVSVHVSEPYLEVCKIMPLFCFYVFRNICISYTYIHTYIHTYIYIYIYIYIYMCVCVCKNTKFKIF